MESLRCAVAIGRNASTSSRGGRAAAERMRSPLRDMGSVLARAWRLGVKRRGPEAFARARVLLPARAEHVEDHRSGGAGADAVRDPAGRVPEVTGAHGRFHAVLDADALALQQHSP